jgi:hypothetical protein
LAAAKALLSGCYCTPKEIKTLVVVVNGSGKDGIVAEDSERVKRYSAPTNVRDIAFGRVRSKPAAPPPALTREKDRSLTGIILDAVRRRWHITSEASFTTETRYTHDIRNSSRSCMSRTPSRFFPDPSPPSAQ